MPARIRRPDVLVMPPVNPAKTFLFAVRSNAARESVCVSATVTPPTATFSVSTGANGVPVGMFTLSGLVGTTLSGDQLLPLFQLVSEAPVHVRVIAFTV